jgi:hypothetical protein
MTIRTPMMPADEPAYCVSVSRRSLLAGGAAAALAAPVTAGAAFDPDPVLMLIERHRAAFRACLLAGEAAFYANRDDPERDTLEEQRAETWDAAEEAALDLMEQPPATIGGALALIDYVVAFNAGALAHPQRPNDWYSGHHDWPEPDEGHDDEVDPPFEARVLENLRPLLARLAGQEVAS